MIFNRLILILLIICAGISGCGSKDSQSDDPSRYNLDLLDSTSEMLKYSQEANIQEADNQGRMLEPLPPGPPYKPTSEKIQDALKNAGFYKGKIDGRIGPLTKTAIEDFQKQNNLKPDGKVGLKTWELLSRYLKD